MEKNNSKASVRPGTIIGAVIAVLLTVLLLNPAWLPLPKQTIEAIQELTKSHFLIERSTKITSAHILTLILALCVMWLCYSVIKLILSAIGKRNPRSRTIAELLVGTIKYIAVIAAIVWGLSILGVNSTAVLAGVGIIGLIIGFGAQSLIEDVITGLFIIFEGKYSIGDVIILDDFRGTVREIGVRTTTIEDVGHNLKVVNNSDIRNFQNRSRNSSVASCVVGVSYSTDLKALEKIMAENLPAMYQAHRDIYLSAPRYLGVEELGDNGVILKIVVDTKEEDIFTSARTLNRDIRVLFSEKGIEIPFPQVVVHRGE
ncbi:MAG: mechanosensitive ion channel family protein [Eubacteriaceae bacterium]|nr:mechanosensitive ion channel family protein [Eubacteriaceae bacterium]